MNKKVDTTKQKKYLNDLCYFTTNYIMSGKSLAGDMQYPLIQGEYLELITKLREVSDLCVTIANNFDKMNSYKED